MMKYLRLYLPMTVLFFTFIFIAGCKKNDNVVNTNNNNTLTPADVSSTTDAAYAVAANLAIDNGGSMEEMSDVLNTATVDGIRGGDITGMLHFGNSHSDVTKSYDSLSGWWTITVARHRGTVNGLYYADYSRVYKFQYLNMNGSFQKFYISNMDTAVTANYQIVSGTGILNTPKVSHQLISLSAAWSVAGINTRTVTLNTTGPYVRAVSDTMTRNNSVRTLNGTLTLNFTNVVGPRGCPLNWHRAVSGTIDGTYHAVVTFQKGTTYKDSTIDKTIHIVFGKHSNPQLAEVDVNNTVYYVDLETGDVTQ
jgi:hypothetical protein